ncbi:MAG: RHS repeat-associated core domain-containing protein [Polyangiaceae bacterium]|nr:RHS repeat-associated core domain-containing protein [Polyangiaceae bacterium]
MLCNHEGASKREPYKFTGKEEDIEVGLSYFGARYYSTALGRWMSPDAVTIHDLGGDLNPYAYVHCTPLMGVDPDGNYAGWDDLAAFGVGFVTSAVTQLVQNGKSTSRMRSWTEPRPGRACTSDLGARPLCRQVAMP